MRVDIQISHHHGISGKMTFLNNNAVFYFVWCFGQSDMPVPCLLLVQCSFSTTFLGAFSIT